jgi:hypothetical protein
MVTSIHTPRGHLHDLLYDSPRSLISTSFITGLVRDFTTGIVQKQMAFTDRKGGIILKICNDLHVREECHIYWWDMNKKAILAALNRKRNDVTAYLKKHFCCMLSFPEASSTVFFLSMYLLCAITLAKQSNVNYIHKVGQYWLLLLFIEF